MALVVATIVRKRIAKFLAVRMTNPFELPAADIDRLGK
jgi:hypothetical protein